MSHNLYALLVGIDKYPNVGDRLNGCINDTEAIEAYLEEVLNREKYQLKIEKLLDEKATRQAIIDKFENHLCQATHNDVVLFYYAGHGSQEIAAPEIWKLDKKLETIVCWDSRQTVDGTEVRDLADKELRYLISKVAQNQPHILVIFDCCHSSSGTRDTDREEGVRRLSVDTRPPRAYHEFLFANKITQDNLSQFPQGQHIFMAACLNSETAKEIAVTTENGKSQNRGLFSYFLLKELHSLNATLSYHDLFREVSARVHGRRKDQTPQLEPINSQEDLRKLAFLGNQDITKPASYFILTYRPPAKSNPGEWIINQGAIGQLEKGSKLTLYLEPSTSGEQVGEVQVIAIRPTESVVQVLLPASLEDTSSFYAILTERPLPTITFYVEGDAEVLAQVENNLSNVRVEHDLSKEHQYRLYAREQRFEITDLDDRKLVEPIDDYNVAEAVRQVEHIACWVKTRDMGNRNSFIPDNALQIMF